MRCWSVVSVWSVSGIGLAVVVVVWCMCSGVGRGVMLVVCMCGSAAICGMVLALVMRWEGRCLLVLFVHFMEYGL